MSLIGVVEVLLLLMGLVLLLLAAKGINSARWQFGWAGLACWLAVEILRGVVGLNVH